MEAETSTPASQPASLPLCLSAWLPGCLAVCRGPVLPESAVLWLDDGAEAKPSLTHGTVDLFRGMESCTAWPNLPRISLSLPLSLSLFFPPSLSLSLSLSLSTSPPNCTALLCRQHYFLLSPPNVCPYSCMCMCMCGCVSRWGYCTTSKMGRSEGGVRKTNLPLPQP